MATDTYTESCLYPNQWVAEGTSWFYSTILRDELGNPVPSSQLTTVTLTLRDWSDPVRPIINAIDNMDVKNATIGNVDSTGLLKLTFRPVDTVIPYPAHPALRRLLLTWTYASGAKTRLKEVFFAVANL